MSILCSRRIFGVQNAVQAILIYFYFFVIDEHLSIAKTGINHFDSFKCAMQRVILESVLCGKTSVPEIHEKYWNSC